jgi:hypothetical protein
VKCTQRRCGAEKVVYCYEVKGFRPVKLNASHLMNTYTLNKTADNLISATLRKELQKLSSESVIVVKTRMTGITSGEPHRCYWNANLCAQSFGGKPVYGWWIMPPTEDAPGLTKLVGHGCWSTPEGLVVNPTMCHFSEILFLPSSTILQLNTLSAQEIPDLYFLEDGYDKDFLYECISEESSRNVPCRIDSREPFWGNVSTKDFPINAIFQPRFFLKEHVDVFKKYLDNHHLLSDPFLYNQLFSPHIETRPGKMHIHIHCHGFSFENIIESSLRSSSKVLAYFAETQTHLQSLVSYDYIREDVMDVLKGKRLYLVNPSSSTGKLVEEIPPCTSLLNEMIPRGNKKKVRKYEKLANQNNLTIQELLLMNDPHYFPHPYLIHKSRKLVRI